MPRIVLAVALAAAALSLAAPSRARAIDPADACLPPAVASGELPSLGATDYGVFLRPFGRIRAVVLFADFSDAPATESPEALYDRIGPPAQTWLSDVSYGRAGLDLTPVLRWYRLPHPSTSYPQRATNRFADVRALIADTVAAADPDVDFSPYQIVDVVVSAGSAVDYSPAFVASPYWGVTADGNTLRYGAALGTDVRDGGPDYAAHVLEHETGHALGLPDLYEALPKPLLWRAAGGWDVMSSTLTGAGFLAWQRLKLGWLDPAQIVCVSSPGRVTATLTPLETAGGLKAVIVRTGPASYTVAEVREPVGADSRLCGRGVLVYRVSATPFTPAPIQVLRSGSDRDLFRVDRCAPAYDAAVGPGSAVFDAAAQARVDVLGSSAAGCRVAVTYGASAARPAKKRLARRG